MSNTPEQGQSLAPPPPSAIKAFDQWAGASANKARKSLNDRSIQNYRSTWFNWISALPADCRWENATPQHITNYLQKVPASARARMKSKGMGERPASPVTQHRYWRVLRDIYTYAVIMGDCSENPCIEATEVPPNEAMASMVLPPWALDTMRAGILDAHAARDNTTWQQIRDDTMMLLLLETAAKTSELTALRADQVWSLETAGNKSQWAVNLDGVRSAQNRHFMIDDEKVGALIAKWLRTRRDIEGVPPWLFFGAKSNGVGAERQRSALTQKSVFILVASVVHKHLPPNAFEGPLSHVGAETIRNSVIRRWIAEGLPKEEVMTRAGVAELRAVTRLALT
jgi:site-specific recombinase XerD